MVRGTSGYAKTPTTRSRRRPRGANRRKATRRNVVFEGGRRTRARSTMRCSYTIGEEAGSRRVTGGKWHELSRASTPWRNDNNGTGAWNEKGQRAIRPRVRRYASTLNALARLPLYLVVRCFTRRCRSKVIARAERGNRKKEGNRNGGNSENERRRKEKRRKGKTDGRRGTSRRVLDDHDQRDKADRVTGDI